MDSSDRVTGTERPVRTNTTAVIGSWIFPILLVALGLGFALAPLSQGGMFFYWDNAQQHYAQTVFLQTGLQQGTIPQWWPNVGLGFPTTAEGQAAHYHPIRLLCAWLFSAPAALMWELGLYFAIAGLSTFFFLREFRLHRTACFLGAVSQMFCGFATIYVRNIALHRSFFLVPLAMLCAERFVRRGDARSLVAAVAVIGVQFLSGHPSFAIVTVVATTVYVVCRTLQQSWKQGHTLGDVGRALGIRSGAWVLAAVVSMGFAAIQVVPTLLHTEQSQRQGGLRFEFATGSQPATVRGLGQLLFPYAYLQGDWLPESEAGWWRRFNTVTTQGMYDGMLCVVLSPLALWWRRRWPDPAVALAASCLLAIGLALGAKTPLFPALWSLPGMNGLRFPSRFLLWAAFCLSCLAALGAHRLIALGRLGLRLPIRLAPIAIVTLFVAALAAALWIVRPEGRNGMALSLMWLAAGLTVAVAVTLTRRRLQIFMVTLAACFAIGDLWFFRAYGNYAQSVPIEAALNPSSHVSFLKRDPEPFRVLALIDTESGAFTDADLRDFVQADLSSIWGIDSADVFLSLFLKRYYAVRSSIVEEITRHPEAAKSLASFLGAMNVKYIVAPMNLTLSGWDRVYGGGQTAIWRNPRVLPRAFLVGNVVPQRFELNEEWRVRSEQRLVGYARTVIDWMSRRVDAQILDHVMARQIDYATTAEVSQPEAVDVRGIDGDAVLQTLRTGPDEMRFSVTSSRPAFLVISSSFYPGWTATVNGQPARLMQTNWVMTGLPIPAGESDVVLQYRTPGYFAGLAASLSVLLLVGVTLVWTAPLAPGLSLGSTRPSASPFQRTRR